MRLKLKSKVPQSYRTGNKRVPAPRVSSFEKFAEAKVNLKLVLDSDLKSFFKENAVEENEEGALIRSFPNEIIRLIDIDDIEILVTQDLAQFGAMKDAELDDGAKAVLTPNAKLKGQVLEKWFSLMNMFRFLKENSDLLSKISRPVADLVKDPLKAAELINKSFSHSDTHDAIFKFETIINVPINLDKTVNSFIDAYYNQINWKSSGSQTVNVKFYYEPKPKIENPLDVVDVHKVNKSVSADAPEFTKKFNEVRERYQKMIEFLKNNGQSGLIDPKWSDPKWLADKAAEELGNE